MKLLFSLHLQNKSQLPLHYTINWKKEIIPFFWLIVQYSFFPPHSINSTSKTDLKPDLSFSLPLPSALCLDSCKYPHGVCIRKEKLSLEGNRPFLLQISTPVQQRSNMAFILFKLWLPLFLISPINVSRLLSSATTLLREGIKARADLSSLLFGAQTLIALSHSYFTESFLVYRFFEN